MEAISRILQPVILYPFSAGIHFLLMSFAGFLVANYDKPRPMVISASIIALWTAYEISEFAQLHDNVSGDLATGLIAYIVGAFGTALYKAWRHRNA